MSWQLAYEEKNEECKKHWSEVLEKCYEIGVLKAKLRFAEYEIERCKRIMKENGW